jgi:hypothetical protein
MMRCPPVPPVAERAKTLATRSAAATVTCAETSEASEPLLHHVHPDGMVTMILPAAHPIAGLAARSSGIAAMIEMRDHAPVPLRQPVRGLLWITGWLTMLPAPAAYQRALAMTEEQPDGCLLDVGHGARMLELAPASLMYSDGEGVASLAPEQFSPVSPDPFHASETDWLRHLYYMHPGLVGRLARHVPSRLRIGPIRPLGIDRLGLRLRIETNKENHDVRLPYTRSVTTPMELSVELRRLISCWPPHLRL